MRKKLACAITLCSLSCLPHANAADVQFVGSWSTDFNTAGNWSPSGVPGGGGNYMMNGLQLTRVDETGAGNS